MLRRGHGAERVFPAGAAGGRRRGLVAFEQERRDFNFVAAGVGAPGGCGFWFGGAAWAPNPGGRLFPGCHACWFCFHNRNSLFLALNALPGEKLRREPAGRNVNFSSGMWIIFLKRTCQQACGGVPYSQLWQI
jgi:hypothetical protein